MYQSKKLFKPMGNGSIINIYVCYCPHDGEHNCTVDLLGPVFPGDVHILITIIVIVAGIVLVVLLYVLNLTVTNGTFYANIVNINDSVFLVNDNVFKPLRVFISFTNLDLDIETCFYNGMDSYAKMWLQLFFPSYLMIIATCFNYYSKSLCL